MGKIYAVRKGFNPGKYYTWDACKEQVIGFSGAEYKSFTNEEDADIYLSGNNIKQQSKGDFSQEEINAMINNFEEIVAFVDGSYDKSQKKYAYGLIALGLGKEYRDCCEDFEPTMLLMNNVAGEILGAETAMEYCISNNVKKLKLYYDYEGIEKWATGAWQCKKTGTQAYKAFYDSICDKLTVEFYKVDAHTGVFYNELADNLAKQALGIQ